MIKEKKMVTAARLFMFFFFFSIILPGSAFSRENQQKIEERVEVNWWQVPVFAVDNSGNPIIDLEAADIEVWLNNRRVEGFVFYRRAFNVIETTEEAVPSPFQPREEQKPEPLAMKRNFIILLFDLTLSAET